MSQPPTVTADPAADPTDAVVELQRLGEEIDTLRAAMQDLQAQHQELKAKHEVQVGMLSDLEAKIPETVRHTRPGIGNAFADNASQKDMDDLIGWVDWLIATYDLVPARQVKPCWPAHPGAVEELAGLRAAWREAAGKDGSQMATWHGLHLAGTLGRLESAYQISRCKPDRCEQLRAAAATKRPDSQ